MAIDWSPIIEPLVEQVVPMAVAAILGGAVTLLKKLSDVDRATRKGNAILENAEDVLQWMKNSVPELEDKLDGHFESLQVIRELWNSEKMSAEDVERLVREIREAIEDSGEIAENREKVVQQVMDRFGL